jgi:hypothetical protein
MHEVSKGMAAYCLAELMGINHNELKVFVFKWNLVRTTVVGTLTVPNIP